MSDKLLKFRAAIDRLDGREPIRKGEHVPLYVDRPDGVAERLARFLQLQPKSQHVLAGPIGCGKSTELAAASRVLNATPGVFSRVIDITRSVDVRGLDFSEFLSVLIYATYATLAAREGAPPALAQGRKFWAGRVGISDTPASKVEASKRPVNAPVQAMVPLHDVPEYLQDDVRELAYVRAVVHQQTGSDLVWQIDGLDRTDLVQVYQRLAPLVSECCKYAGVGVVFVAPWRALISENRPDLVPNERAPVEIGALDPKIAANAEFLRQVLARRVDAELMPDPSAEALIAASGGVIRCLLQLAARALTEVWMHNRQTMTEVEIATAVDEMGRSMLFGKSDREVSLLREVGHHGRFDGRGWDDLALVQDTVVLQYRGVLGELEHHVHPCLWPLIDDGIPF